jgi:hypothetical protein
MKRSSKGEGGGRGKPKMEVVFLGKYLDIKIYQGMDATPAQRTAWAWVEKVIARFLVGRPLPGVGAHVEFQHSLQVET